MLLACYISKISIISCEIPNSAVNRGCRFCLVRLCKRRQVGTAPRRFRLAKVRELT